MGDELTITKTGVTRQQIVDTAEAIILGNGFTAVGLNEILCSAGVSEGSFYHYFKSKEQFGDALLEDYLSQLVLALKDNGSNISSRLMAFLPSWLDSQSCDDTSDKCLVVKLSSEVMDLSETMHITLKNGTDRVIDRLTSIVEHGIVQGEFPANLDAKNVTAEIYFMWIGATLLTKVSRTREALERAMNATKTRLA